MTRRRPSTNADRVALGELEFLIFCLQPMPLGGVHCSVASILVCTPKWIIDKHSFGAATLAYVWQTCFFLIHLWSLLDCFFTSSSPEPPKEAVSALSIGLDHLISSSLVSLFVSFCCFPGYSDQSQPCSQCNWTMTLFKEVIACTFPSAF